MKGIKLIYSFLYPEVRQIQEQLWRELPHYLFDQSYLQNQEGKEKEFIDYWKEWTNGVINHNPKLSHFYPTNGSSEAIREVIYQLKNKGRTLILLENDYEGYKAFALSCGMRMKIIKREDILNYSFNETDTLIISHPSSIDGCLYQDYDLLMKRIDSLFPETTVYLDLCYVGCLARDYQINLNYKCIQGYFMSLSKVFGVYYHRIGGLVSKNPESGLYGNRWFKNMFSLELGLRLMKTFKVRELPNKILKHQNELVDELSQELGVDIVPSDVVILAKSSEIIEEYQRGDISRICLTPGLDDKTKANK